MMMNRLRMVLAGLLVIVIAGFFSPVQAESGKKGGKKTPPGKKPIELTYINDTGMTAFSKQPKITPEHMCLLGNPEDDSVHAIRFMDKGIIRVYQGNENLEGTTPQVAFEDMNNVYRSVMPGTDTPITVVAKFTWAYDNRGMLTIYNGAPGEGRAIYQFNFVTSSKQDPGKIMYMGIYTPNSRVKPASLTAAPAKFAD